VIHTILPANLTCGLPVSGSSTGFRKAHGIWPEERPAAASDRFDELATNIDWSNAAAQLAKGQLTTLPTDIGNKIHAHAQRPDIVSRAAELGLDPIMLVIALVARRVWAREIELPPASSAPSRASETSAS
jgi:hypothetical protein